MEKTYIKKLTAHYSRSHHF